MQPLKDMLSILFLSELVEEYTRCWNVQTSLSKLRKFGYIFSWWSLFFFFFLPSLNYLQPFIQHMKDILFNCVIFSAMYRCTFILKKLIWGLLPTCNYYTQRQIKDAEQTRFTLPRSVPAPQRRNERAL